MNIEVPLRKQTYAGLFMVALATLMYEILLTRIFSVTMWYHYAFVAISVAMFGMTVGALIVYLLPDYFSGERAKFHLAISSLLFAISIIFSFMTHLAIPFVIQGSIIGLYLIALTYVVISIPFIFSGICISLALTKFPRDVSKLYAADLAGAALGCILLVVTLNVTDGPTAVVVVAFLASLGSILFLSDARVRKFKRIALIWSLLLLCFAITNTFLVANHSSWFRLMWVKGKLEDKPIYDKWNSFSRLRVYGNPNILEAPSGWGLSVAYHPTKKTRQLFMDIDANAATLLAFFNGDLSEIDYLKYDVTNLAHYIRKDSDVLVVGTGGGRDILSALAFEQKSVLGVEINQDIIKAVNQTFGEFTGHLDKNPKVKFVNDEARSYIARSLEKFDIIQVSLIDTWAATAAGAFVLTENSLYTLEGWRIFLDHLTPNGVLTFSRWYYRDGPGEMYRLASLASASLMQMGVEHPNQHMIIVRRMLSSREDVPDGIGTLLVSKSPFSDQDVQIIENIAHDFQFEIVLTPKASMDSTLAKLASGKNLDEFTANFPINIVPPTDDSPFFFHVLRLRDIFRMADKLPEKGVIRSNMMAVFVLGSLMIIVVGLTFLCIIVPLTVTTRKDTLRGTLPLFIFFSGIGLGFMLIEISQMQRLNIFLGHPTYSLSLVLFALLLSSSLGSYSTKRKESSRGTILRMLLLLAVLIVFGSVTPGVIGIFQKATTAVRMIVALALLFPLGLMMGMAFPLGIKLASKKSPVVMPWFWGINGAMSVCASVLAVVIALNSGISTSFWAGLFCYAVAVIAFIWASRKQAILEMV